MSTFNHRFPANKALTALTTLAIIGTCFAASESRAAGDLLPYAKQSLTYLSGSDSVKILKVPRAPMAFSVKGPGANEFQTAFKKAKDGGDAKNVFGLLEWCTKQQKPSDTFKPPQDFADLVDQIANLNNQQYYIAVVTNTSPAPLFLLALVGSAPLGEYSPTEGPKATDQTYIAPTAVTMQAFQNEPDGSLTTEWKPTYYASVVVYGDEAFIRKAQEFLSGQIEKDCAAIDSKVKLGDLTPSDGNRKKWEAGVARLRGLTTEFEQDGNFFLRMATVDSCAVRLAEAAKHYSRCFINPKDEEGSEKLVNAELMSKMLVIPEIGAQGLNEQQVQKVGFAENLEKNPMAAFPGSWVKNFFPESETILCPADRQNYSILPPISFVLASSMSWDAQEMPIHWQMNAQTPPVAVCYCPFHEIVGLDRQNPTRPDSIYVGLKTNWLQFTECGPVGDLAEFKDKEVSHTLTIYYWGQNQMGSTNLTMRPSQTFDKCFDALVTKLRQPPGKE